MALTDKAILVVSFGTSCEQSREKSIASVENELALSFPKYHIARAFTSGMILHKLKERDKIEIDNVAQALERLAAMGIREVLCQPTHIIPGDEFEKMMNDAQPFINRFDILRFGKPLLSSTRDFKEVTSAAMLALPDDTALIWMGHGSGHFADCAYAALAYHYNAQGYQNVFVATVEGYPTLDDILPDLAASGLKKVILAPFMLVAGDHAQNDMAGDKPDSWKVMLSVRGYDVSCYMSGLGESERIRRMIVQHVAELQRF